MKTKEFIKKVQALGYEVEVDLESMFIIKIEGTAVCDVSKTEFGILDTDSYSEFKHIGYKKQRELFPILADYASTDPEDREEEKRYRLRYDVPPLLREVHAKPKYLYIRRCDGYKDTSLSQADDSAFKTIFTESEIAEMDITGFEKEPVECEFSNN